MKLKHILAIADLFRHLRPRLVFTARRLGVTDDTTVTLLNLVRAEVVAFCKDEHSGFNPEKFKEYIDRLQ